MMLQTLAAEFREIFDAFVAPQLHPRDLLALSHACQRLRAHRHPAASHVLVFTQTCRRIKTSYRVQRSCYAWLGGHYRIYTTGDFAISVRGGTMYECIYSGVLDAYRRAHNDSFIVHSVSPKGFRIECSSVNEHAVTTQEQWTLHVITLRMLLLNSRISSKIYQYLDDSSMLTARGFT